MATSKTQKAPAKPAAKKAKAVFSAEEIEAMQATKAERKKGGANGEADLKAAIAKLTGTDRQLAEKLDAIVRANAPDLTGKTLLLVDPMLATGESMELAWKAFLTKGTPAKLQIACVIASRQGVEHLQNLFPGDEVSLWCGAIDPEMNEHSYIVPGLGDAGDLSFGDKL